MIPRLTSLLLLALVYKAACNKPCTDNNPDTTSVENLYAPIITETTITCQDSQMIIHWADNPSPTRTKSKITCDSSDGQWKVTVNGFKTPKLVKQDTKVSCEVSKASAPFVPVHEGPNTSDVLSPWNYSLTITICVMFVLAVTIPLVAALTKLRARNHILRVDKHRPRVWTDIWNAPETIVNEWSWQVVTEFLTSWETKTVEEKVKLIETGYYELGYKSSITQMLYIFEWMLLVEEKHHLVWRPMFLFLVRMKRLATPPFSDPDIMFRFTSWIAMQGKKIMDVYGLFAKSKEDKNDIHIPYMRFIGVHLMSLGNGAKAKAIFEDLNQLFLAKNMDVPGPMRIACAANRIMRDGDLLSFEKTWDNIMKADSEKLYKATEWGTLQDNVMYSLGWAGDEAPNNMLMDFMVKSKKIGKRDFLKWLQGTNERGNYCQLPFIVKNFKVLHQKGKLTPEDDELYEGLREFCMFEHSTFGWHLLEDFVASYPTLAKRLNVPALRRRTEHFTKQFKLCGDAELDAFLSNSSRSDDIDEIDTEEVKKPPPAPKTPAGKNPALSKNAPGSVLAARIASMKTKKELERKEQEKLNPSRLSKASSRKMSGLR